MYFPISFRADEQRMQKLESIMQALGVNRTDAITALIDHAQLTEVKLIRPVATLAIKESASNGENHAV